MALVIVADRIRTRVQMTTDDSRISELPLDCASCKITGGIACFVLGAMSLYNIRTPAWQGKPIARTGVQLFAVGKIAYLFFYRIENYKLRTLIRRKQTDQYRITQKAMLQYISVNVRSITLRLLLPRVSSIV